MENHKITVTRLSTANRKVKSTHDIKFQNLISYRNKKAYCDKTTKKSTINFCPTQSRLQYRLLCTVSIFDFGQLSLGGR